MADKAIADYLVIMDEVIDNWFFVDLPIERALKAEQLYDTYRLTNKETQAFSSISVETAYQQIENKMSKDDQIFVFGSFITVAEMLKIDA